MMPIGSRNSTLVRSPVKTIGFLVDWLDGVYQNELLNGVRDAARERRVQLLCISGGILQSAARGGPHRNAAFEFAKAENVDGLILVSGTIGNQIGPGELLAYASRFGALPRVSIAVNLPGTASVVIDNRTGIESAITHLIRVHACQRIAFVRGPEQNPEAELRYQMYRSVLRQNALVVDEQLIVSGDFLLESGRRAVTELYEHRGLRPEAIVTANDHMAIGVLEELAARKIAVPGDVAVVGFDDVEEARFTSPPLTTVRQPLYEQGREAVRLLLNQLYGSASDERTVLHTELIARRSCRCFGDQLGISLPAPARRASFEAALVERRQILLANLARAGRGAFGILGSGWEARLISAFTTDLREGSQVAFATAIEEGLLKLLEQKADFNLFHDVLSTLRRHLLACLEADPERRARAEDIFQNARTLVGQASERAQAQQKILTLRWANALAGTGTALLSCVEVGQLQRAVAEHFPKLGVRSCFVSLYAEHPSAPNQLAVSYTSASEFPAYKAAAARRSDLPRWLLDNGVADGFYFSTLFSEERVLALVLLDLGTREGIVYEALREFLNAAVKNISLHARSRKTDAPPPL
ncbi:MAG: substrate-binding domain-containing protein [Pseudomonadota bacterium]